MVLLAALVWVLCLVRWDKAMQDLTKTDGMRNIERLEEAIGMLPQVEPEIRHFFLDGVYMRQLYIPKGHALTGKVHTTESYSIILKGDISVVNDENISTRLMQGDIVYSKPGSKKAGYAHDDTLFLTVHKVNTKSCIENIEAIEDELSASTFEEYTNKLSQQLKLEAA